MNCVSVRILSWISVIGIELSDRLNAEMKFSGRQKAEMKFSGRQNAEMKFSVRQNAEMKFSGRQKAEMKLSGRQNAEMKFSVRQNAEMSQEDMNQLDQVLTLPFALFYSIGAILIVAGLVMVGFGLKKKNQHKVRDEVKY